MDFFSEKKERKKEWNHLFPSVIFVLNLLGIVSVNQLTLPFYSQTK